MFSFSLYLIGIVKILRSLRTKDVDQTICHASHFAALTTSFLIHHLFRYACLNWILFIICMCVCVCVCVCLSCSKTKTLFKASHTGKSIRFTWLKFKYFWLCLFFIFMLFVLSRNFSRCLSKKLKFLCWHFAAKILI